MSELQDKRSRKRPGVRPKPPPRGPTRLPYPSIHSSRNPAPPLRPPPSGGPVPRPPSPLAPNSAYPVSSAPERRVNRRFSYTLTRNPNRDVPYARLVEQPTLPAKLDSDSKLHTEKKTILLVPDSETGPKNSVSDSKLAVDYFTTDLNPGQSSQIKTKNRSVEHATNLVNVSESHHSLSTRLGSQESVGPAKRNMRLFEFGVIVLELLQEDMTLVDLHM